MPNQLQHETSPYLLQHAENPVDWYPWGDVALALARETDRPILLSIGYAACHWCHVMAHESFEDPATAAFMNQHFVNVKVDREERPDLDSIYMNAVVAMTGQGGWPMTVILTPAGQPFFGGTYYPPAPRFGMPSFMQVLQGVARAWRDQRSQIKESAASVAAHLGQRLSLASQEGSPPSGLLSAALEGLLRSFDGQQGGFGQAPKFPPSMTLAFLLWMHYQEGDAMALHMAELTLEKMAYGGMYDQLGGGFARYSTDAHWLVPHFEKMLYDNALLARVYLQAYQVTRRPLYRRVAEETLDFVARELRHEEGGFYSSYDADSEGEEGRFYVWSAEEIGAVLGEDAPLFMRCYGVTPGGNWEGHNILHVAEAPDAVAAEAGMTEPALQEKLARARRRLAAVRARRVWPGLDDKVLTGWNGLMLAAFADGARILQRADYLEVARANAAFLRRAVRDEAGRLYRSWKAGAGARYKGYLEDYAYLADGLLALYGATFEPAWFAWARELADLMLTHFRDPEDGGFFDTADDHEALLHRPKEVQDNATPSANAMAARVLLRLSLYTGESALWEVAATATTSMQEAMNRYPTGFAHWLGNAALILGAPREVAIVGDLAAADTRALLAVVAAGYYPDLVVAAGQDGAVVPLLAERPQLSGQATAYVCRRFVCRQPVTEPAALAEQLRAA